MSTGLIISDFEFGHNGPMTGATRGRPVAQNEGGLKATGGRGHCSDPAFSSDFRLSPERVMVVCYDLY